MAKKKRGGELGVSLEPVVQSITDLQERIRALRVTRGTQQDEKDDIIDFLEALKRLLKALCRRRFGRFIPFFLDKPGL